MRGLQFVDWLVDRDQRQDAVPGPSTQAPALAAFRASRKRISATPLVGPHRRVVAQHPCADGGIQVARVGDVRSHDPGTGQRGAAEVDASQTRSDQPRISHVGVPQERLVQARMSKIRTRQVETFQVRATQIQRVVTIR